MTDKKKRVLSGIQPSGTLHLGNYFGMMKPAIEMQNDPANECYYFIADYHALTQTPQPDMLRRRSREVALDFLACGLDPERAVFFRQSDIPEILQLTWVLSCLTPLGLLERCHSYKDKVARGLPANAGLFNYPVLMAADILIYNSNLVPVGKDQKQHLEVARDLAQKFNHQYGGTLVEPEAIIQNEVAVIPGINGQKMSKSYDNIIEIFGPEKKTRQKIMSIKTDSTPIEEPKNPEQCNVFALYKLFADSNEVSAMEKSYRRGGIGYGNVKQALFDKYQEYFAVSRERRRKLAADPDRVEEILTDGARKARRTAKQVLAKVLAAVGISPQSQHTDEH